jgi:hypothetical protein
MFTVAQTWLFMKFEKLLSLRLIFLHFQIHLALLIGESYHILLKTTAAIALNYKEIPSTADEVCH